MQISLGQHDTMTVEEMNHIAQLLNSDWSVMAYNSFSSVIIDCDGDILRQFSKTTTVLEFFILVANLIENKAKYRRELEIQKQFRDLLGISEKYLI